MGKNWSNNVVGPTLANFPIYQGFDGNTSTYTYADNGEGDQLTATFDIPGTTFRIYAWAGTGFELEVNGVDIGAASRVWVDISSIVAATGGSLQTIVAKAMTSSSSAGWSAIEVDGKILVDHNNIGVDASGTGNNFYDQNFAVGNTSQVWSQYVAGTPWDTVSYLPVNAFNGSLLNGALPAAGDSYVWTPPAGIKVTNVQASISAVGSASNIIFNSGESNESIVNIATVAQNQWTTVTLYSGAEVDLKNITWNSASESDYVSVGEILSSGVLFIDANIQDTVIDTPITPYDVLEVLSGATLSNGNLVSTTSAGGASSCNNDLKPNTGRYYSEMIVTANAAVMQLGDTANAVWSENQGGSVGDVIGATYDTSNGDINFYVNGAESSSKTNSNGGNVVYQQAGTGTGTIDCHFMAVVI